MESSRPAPARQLGLGTAALIVVANMIGTGIFTTTGFLARDLQSTTAILFAWTVGALYALAGALAYGQLTAHLPQNGGEYHLLSRIYHPALGFVAGVISFVVGFSAPIAAAALAFGKYFAAIFPGTNPVLLASLLVLAASLVHALNVRIGSGLQNVFAFAKILLIVTFSAMGFAAMEGLALFSPDTRPLTETVMSPAFSLGIIFVSFAYSGWNGAAYLAGEIKDPKRSLPYALVAGTLIVSALYVTLNVLFLSAVSLDEISGVVEVGHVVAIRLFGNTAGKFLSGLIAIALISTVSAMVMTGPRVSEVMGRDYKALAFLNRRWRQGGPVTAIVLQAVVVLIMLQTLAFDALLTYIGFTLSISAAITVAGVFVIRKELTDKGRWGYPVLPILFIALSLWVVLHAIRSQPAVSIGGLATVVLSLVLYALCRKSAVAR